MSELLDKQQLFFCMVGQLIPKVAELGYDGATFGEAWRHPDWAAEMERQGKGIANSLHCERLAIDLNLFRDGKYLTDTEDYRKLGEWWEGIGGSWGGRFGDGNHFSLAHGGRR